MDSWWMFHSFMLVECTYFPLSIAQNICISDAHEHCRSLLNRTYMHTSMRFHFEKFRFCSVWLGRTGIRAGGYIAQWCLSNAIFLKLFCPKASSHRYIRKHYMSDHMRLNFWFSIRALVRIVCLQLFSVISFSFLVNWAWGILRQVTNWAMWMLCDWWINSIETLHCSHPNQSK